MATGAGGALFSAASATGNTPTVSSVQISTGYDKKTGPTWGDAAGSLDGTGVSVYITGTNLDTVTSVAFGAASTTKVLAVDSTHAWVDVPAAANALVTENAESDAVDVTVTNPDGSATATDGYAYMGAPTLTSGAVSEDGKSYTVTGTNLDSATTLVVGGKSTKLKDADSTSTTVTVKTPSLKGTTFDVTVTTPWGTDTLVGGFGSAPAVSKLTPAKGDGLGGTFVSVTGTGLSGVTSVKVDSQTASFVALSDTAIVFKTPAYTGEFDKTGTKTVEVVLTSSNGAGKAAKFIYQAFPTLADVDPAADTSGPLAGGQTLTITGTNLLGVSVLVDSLTAKVDKASNTATSVTFTVPKGKTAGEKVVAVKNANATVVYGGTWTYNPLPTITTLDPATGVIAGGTTVTVTGTNFTGDSKVYFGSAEAVCTVASATSISCASPAVAKAGKAYVKVSDAANGVSAAATFTYTAS